MTNYLPQHATIEEACEWLSAETGESWSQSRLLESNLTPWFWVNYDENYPSLSGGRIEGYLSRMVFHGDIVRLAIERSTVRVNMFTTHDGEIVKVEPAVSIPLPELRYLRGDLEDVAYRTNNAEPEQAPEIASDSGTTLRGINKQTVADAFDGLHFTYDRWLKTLAAPPVWLEASRVCKGNKATSALWNPVSIAFALLGRHGNVPIKKLDAVFVGLKDWQGEWQEKSANDRKPLP